MLLDHCGNLLCDDLMSNQVGMDRSFGVTLHNQRLLRFYKETYIRAITVSCKTLGNPADEKPAKALRLCF